MIDAIICKLEPKPRAYPLRRRRVSWSGQIARIRCSLLLLLLLLLLIGRAVGATCWRLRLWQVLLAETALGVGRSLRQPRPADGSLRLSRLDA